MSKKHPIISVTGSSGAGTTSVTSAFENIFIRLELNPLVMQGDSFHRYTRSEMKEKLEKANREGRHFSHFSAEANILDKLEDLFRQYGENGTGKTRYYIHNSKQCEQLGQPPGTFTPWQEIPENTDLLFYEGLHGAAKTESIDVGRHADLRVGVVPILNLEWIQKIHRDTEERGYKPEDVTDMILRRMYDYAHMITPQFSETDINFQRVPTVDTSNPFVSRDVPTADESFVVIRFKDPQKFEGVIDFPYLIAMLHGSFMSRRNSIVVPGAKMGLAMEIIFMPIIRWMIEQKNA